MNIVTLKVEFDDFALNPRIDYDNLGHMLCWHRKYNLGDEHSYEKPVDFLKQLVGDTLSVDDVIRYTVPLPNVKFNFDRILDTWTFQHQCEGCAEPIGFAFQSKVLLENPDLVKENILKLLSINELKTLAYKRSVIMPIYLYDHGGITISCVNSYPYNDFWDGGQVGWIYVSYDEIKNEYGDDSKESIEKARTLLKSEVNIYDYYLRGSCYRFVIEEDGVEKDSRGGFLGDLKDVIKDMGAYVAEEYHHLFDHIKYDRMEYSERIEKQMV